MRFFEGDRASAPDASALAGILWDRRKLIAKRGRRSPYVELYEMDALDALCATGLVHAHLPAFRATRAEVRQVLGRLLTLLQSRPMYAVGFCREKLPFPFVLRGRDLLTVDVPLNYPYQRIQGLVIRDEQVCKDFSTEFRRLGRTGVAPDARTDARKLLTTRLETLAVTAR
jgi:hypothetical protein